MPKRKHLNLAMTNTIVEVVVNSREMQAPHGFRPDVQHRCADAGFGAQKRKRLRQFFVQGFRSKRAILIPPQRSAARSICTCARFVTRTFTAYSAVTTGEFRKYLFG